MAKEIYLFSTIYPFAAERLVAQLEEYKDEDILLRMDSPGGLVNSGWAIISKLIEHKGKVTIRVTGSAMSMAAMMLLYADTVEAYDTSNIMLHQANGYAETPEAKAFLQKVNTDLKAKLLKRVDSEKMKQLRGVSVEEMFSGENRDIFMSAQQAKSIGLVDKVLKADPKELEALGHEYQHFYNIAAEHKPATPTPQPTEQSSPKNNRKMTLDQLKNEHPEVYAAAVKLGVDQENDRVGAWMAFQDADPAAVKAGIDGGQRITQKEMAELSLKSFNKTALANLEQNSHGAIQTDEPPKPKSEQEKELEAFQAEVNKKLNLKKTA